MCKYCEHYGTWDSKTLGKTKINLGVVGELEVELSLMGEENTEDGYSLFVDVRHEWMDLWDSDNPILIDKDINYCPMCGRKLAKLEAES